MLEDYSEEKRSYKTCSLWPGLTGILQSSPYQVSTSKQCFVFCFFLNQFIISAFFCLVCFLFRPMLLARVQNSKHQTKRCAAMDCFLKNQTGFELLSCVASSCWRLSLSPNNISSLYHIIHKWLCTFGGSFTPVGTVDARWFQVDTCSFYSFIYFLYQSKDYSHKSAQRSCVKTASAPVLEYHDNIFKWFKRHRQLTGSNLILA